MAYQEHEVSMLLNIYVYILCINIFVCLHNRTLEIQHIWFQDQCNKANIVTNQVTQLFGVLVHINYVYTIVY